MKCLVFDLYFLLALLLFTTGCSKDDYSDCFEEKVSCYVNGEYWEDCCDNCGSVFGGRSHIDCSHRVGSSQITLSVGSNCGNFDIGGNLWLGSKELKTTGKLIHNTTRFATSSMGCSTFLIDSSKQSQIFIDSIDEENQRIKGTFSFHGEDECGEESIQNFVFERRIGGIAQG